MMNKVESGTSIYNERRASGLTAKLLAVGAALLVCNVVGALIAVAMGPLLNASFGNMIRTPDGDGLLVPALMSGYLVISIALVWLDTKLRPSSLAAAATTGLTLGLAVFLGGHLVVAGWSLMPAISMAVSGALDSLAVAAAAIAVALVQRRSEVR